MDSETDQETGIDGDRGWKGVTIEPLVRSTKQSVARLTLETNGVVPLHFHLRTEEIFLCMSGEGVFEADGVPTTFGEGAVVIVPASTRHTLVNNQTQPLRVAVVSVPPYDPSDTHYA
jgi:mannose-6-phosphate isomerase-like protein (cupin superfamily)